MVPQQFMYPPQLPMMPQQQLFPQNIPNGYGGVPFYGGMVTSIDKFLEGTILFTINFNYYRFWPRISTMRKS